MGPAERDSNLVGAPMCDPVPDGKPREKINLNFRLNNQAGLLYLYYQITNSISSIDFDYRLWFVLGRFQIFKVNWNFTTHKSWVGPIKATIGFDPILEGLRLIDTLRLI